MEAAFPDSAERSLNSTGWAELRPTLAEEVRCSRVLPTEMSGGVRAPHDHVASRRSSSAFIPLASVVHSAVHGRPPAKAKVALAVLQNGAVDAIVYRHSIWLDESVVLVPATVVSRAEARRAHGADSTSAPSRAVEIPHEFPDMVLPVLPTALRVARNEVLDVTVDVSTQFVWAPFVARVTDLHSASGGVLGPSGSHHVNARTSSGGVPTGGLFPLWHISMINDARRNAAYANAIRRAVTPGESHVLELGAGAGLLSVLAAKAGAAYVAAVEADDRMLPRLQATIAANNVTTTVAVLPVHSSKVTIRPAQAPLDATHAGIDALGTVQHIIDAAIQAATPTMPRGADIIVHEIFDFTVTGEGVVPSVQDAVARLLKKAQGDVAGTIIPARARVHAMLIESPQLRHRYDVSRWLANDALGQEPGRANSAAKTRRDAEITQFHHVLPGLKRFPQRAVALPINLRNVQHVRLSEPVVLYELDFARLPAELAGRIRAQPQPMGSPKRIACSRGGTVAALVTWFSLHFDQGDDLKYSTGPDDMMHADHWYQSAEILPVAFNVSAADVVHVQPEVWPGAGGFPGVRSVVSIERRGQ